VKACEPWGKRSSQNLINKREGERYPREVRSNFLFLKTKLRLQLEKNMSRGIT